MPELFSGQIGSFCESLIDGEEPLAQIGVNWVLAIFCGSMKEKYKYMYVFFHYWKMKINMGEGWLFSRTFG